VCEKRKEEGFPPKGGGERMALMKKEKSHVLSFLIESLWEGVTMDKNR